MNLAQVNPAELHVHKKGLDQPAHTGNLISTITIHTREGI